MPSLRPWRPSLDASGVLDAFVTASDLRRQAPPIRDLNDAERYLERMAPHALAIDVDGAAVGMVAASEENAVHGTVWMSYWLMPHVRGRGLAARGLATLARRAFDRGLHRLELGARANNPASVAVARRAGFVQEGIEREALCYDGERFDVVRLARLVTDPDPGLALIEVRA